MKTLLLALSSMAAASVASAIPVTLDIDFRSNDWAPAEGNHSFSTSGVTATAFADDRNANLTQDSTTGLGVDSRVLFEDPGEVGPKEILKVDFSGGTGASITGAWVTKLFIEWLIFDLTDMGYAVLNGTQTINFEGAQWSSQNSLGDLWVDFGGAVDLTTISFFGTGSVLANRDYSVAGFTKQTAVPDGGLTVALFGAALLGIVAVRRRIA